MQPQLEKIDLVQRRDLVNGICDLQVVDGVVAFSRLPSPLLDYYAQPEGKFIRSRCTAGVRIRFRSDTRMIRLALRFGKAIEWATDHAVDLAVNGRLIGPFVVGKAAAGSSWSQVIFEQPHSVAHEFDCWLPSLCEGRIERLEVEESSGLEGIKPAARRWLALGDSITQGVYTRSPAGTYAATAAALLGVELHNMGVGGAVVVPEIAFGASAVPADIITVALGVNDYLGGRNADEFARVTRSLLDDIRQRQARTPIIWISPTPIPARREQRNTTGLLLQDYTRIIQEQAQRIGGVIVIDGTELLPDESRWFLGPGNCHPNDAGHQLYGERLAAALRPWLRQ